MDALKRAKFKEQLANLKMPVFIMHGRWDPFIVPQHAHNLHLAIPGSRLLYFEDSGHMPFFEQSGLFMISLKMFLAEK
jgi:proline iminopeptidase